MQFPTMAGPRAFYSLRRTGTESVISEHFRRQQLGSSHFDAETRAATRIQSLRRGSEVRFRWHTIQRAVALLQRIGRGFLGRLRARNALLERMKLWNEKNL